MISASFLPVTIWLLATDLVTQLVVAVVFPMLLLGLAVKFFRNIDKP